MKEEDFNRLFENFSEYDLLSISEIRHILVNENEMENRVEIIEKFEKESKDKTKELNMDENKINSFLNTKIEVYAFSHSFRCDVRLMNVLGDFFGIYDKKQKRTILDITFRDLLKLCDCNLGNLLHLRNFGKATLGSLVDIYKANGVNPYEYREWE